MASPRVAFDRCYRRFRLGCADPEKPEQQFVTAFERLKLVLEEAGCGMSDLVRLVSYHIGLSTHRAEFAEVKSQYVPEPFPTWTILDIAGLALPGLIIEIATTIRPRCARSRRRGTVVPLRYIR